MKTLFITGATRGIGRAILQKFIDLGYVCGYIYNSSDDLACEIDSKFGCVSYKGDVSDFDFVRESIEDFVSRFKRIDVLVNNASLSSYDMFQDETYESWNRLFSVNVFGMFNTCKCAIPYMISERNGSIVNISSVWGIVGASCETIYSATKGSINSFTKALAKEVGLSNIRVNAVAPGPVLTDMMGDFTEEELDCIKSESALNRFTTLDEIAEFVYFVATQNSLTGQVLSPNSGYLIY